MGLLRSNDLRLFLLTQTNKAKGFRQRNNPNLRKLAFELKKCMLTNEKAEYARERQR